jgi:hypothetical protein
MLEAVAECTISGVDGIEKTTYWSLIDKFIDDASSLFDIYNFLEKE